MVEKRLLCVVEFPEFWRLLDKNSTKEKISIFLKAYTGTPEDTIENRRTAYNNLLAYLRETNQLCEHEDHKHSMVQ